jgi:nucleotide-binding universal stress UspA family protein
MSLFSKNRVLVPIDFSEISLIAQEEALQFVEHPSHLHIIHVLPPLSPLEPGVIWQTIDDKHRKQNVEKTFKKKFNSPEYQQVNFEVLFGEPSTKIIDYAKEHKIELIVIPSHGRTGLGRFLLGSIAERVVRFAHCPVLVLRQ